MIRKSDNFALLNLNNVIQIISQNYNSLMMNFTTCFLFTGDDKEFPCEGSKIIPMRSVNHQDLNEHVKAKEYKCEKCDKQFTSKYRLKTHVKTVHLKIKDYTCGSCDKQFTDSSKLKFHVKTVHLKAREY